LSLEGILREPQARLGQSGQVTTGLSELRQMPEEAARLAGRQLLMLEGGPFVWQGQVWPGQAMQWHIEERLNSQVEGEEEGGWRTELTLTLPRLGSVQAAIHLSAHGLGLELAAGAKAAADELRAGLPELTQRLHQAGLQVLGAGVRVEVEADARAAAA